MDSNIHPAYYRIFAVRIVLAAVNPRMRPQNRDVVLRHEGFSVWRRHTCQGRKLVGCGAVPQCFFDAR
ncbi:MAG: hypothetical protein IKK82_09510 [Kiritimatiellae bacterium]|nr:hypothetical protein [Kiritimatiellia bacterium]